MLSHFKTVKNTEYQHDGCVVILLYLGYKRDCKGKEEDNTQSTIQQRVESESFIVSYFVF
ncbi:unnamed protein product [Brassica oleracea]